MMLIFTNAHVSIIGHITRDELLRRLDRTECDNGFANRFLWFWVERSKLLPDGAPEPPNFTGFDAELGQAIEHARHVAGKPLLRYDDAAEHWRAIYGDLSADRPGLVGAVTARAEAQVMRLALLYALLDRKHWIERVHLEAALAVWRFAFESAVHIFGERRGDPVQDRIIASLREQGWLTKTALRDQFSRHVHADRLDAALGALEADGVIELREEKTSGRPRTLYALLEE
jgi:hypothetical protein